MMHQRIDVVRSVSVLGAPLMFVYVKKKYKLFTYFDIFSFLSIAFPLF